MNQLSYVPIHKKADKTDCRNYHGTSLLPTSYKILSNILLSRIIPDADEIIGITNVDFYVIGQQLIRPSIFFRYRRKRGSVIVQYNSWAI
jgi:hypothetical protein